MPTIDVDLSDLDRLLGRHIDDEALNFALRELGMEVEDSTPEGLRVEVAHNRPDLYSIEGVARALKGFLGIETGLSHYEIEDPKLRIEVNSSVENVRPFIVGGVVEEADLDEPALQALMDLQEKLHDSVGRDRRKISIGVYDLDKVEPPIRYKTTSPKGTKFIPLEMMEELTPSEILKKHPKGVKYAHIIEEFDRYPLLVDSNDQVLSMPPIINSEPTRVTEDSEKLLIDVTGVEETAAKQSLKVMMSALGERGFGLRAVHVKYPDRKVRTPSSRTVRRRLDVGRANEAIGLELTTERAIEIMKRMRYGVEKVKGDRIYVRVPFYRTDIMHEIDLIEDLAIGFGYDKLEPTMPALMTFGEVHPIERVSEKARQALIGLGFMEVMTYTLTSPRLNFELMRTDGEAVTVSNPVSEDYSILRTWILPGLLDVLRENRHHELPQNIFEVGDVLLLDEDEETGAKNLRRAAAASIGEEESFTHAKAVAEAVMRELETDWEVEPFDHPSFLDGRSAQFKSNGSRIGMVGEIHPEVILAFELEYPVVAFELNLSR